MNTRILSETDFLNLREGERDSFSFAEYFDAGGNLRFFDIDAFDSCRHCHKGAGSDSNCFSWLERALSPNGSGILLTEVSPKEAEEFKQGKRFDKRSLWQRFSAQAEKHTEMTGSLDAAFFEDGTFVGPDTTNFFAQTQAIVNAKRDFVNELAAGLSDSGKDNNSLYRRLRETANQPIESLDSKSTPADFYNYFKQLSAIEFLRMKDVQGEDGAIEMVLRPMNKSLVTLRKQD